MNQLQACPLCGTESFQHAYSGRTTRNPDDPKRWELVRCLDCDHGFLNPQPQWDELAEYYHSAYPPYDPNHGVTEDFEAVAASARETGTYRHVSIRPGLRILDVGCGGGSFLAVAQKMGAEVQGVEPSEVAAERARQLGLNVTTGTLETFAETNPDARYDMITFSHVVEHLTDPVHTLKVAASLLNKEGMVWVAVPNGACGFARRLGWRWYSTDLPLHLQHFSITSMKTTAERAGLKVETIYTYSLPAAVRMSMLVEWKQQFRIPQRISRAIWTEQRAEKLAKKLDQESAGEAILVEMTKP